MPDHKTLIPEALAFLEALAENNNRAWFAAHKADYDAQVKQPAQALLGDIGNWLTAQSGAAPTTKIYRINRDLRFSKDKTPYNTHLHMQWGDPDTGICHLFGVSQAYVCAGVGIMGFDKPALDRWRSEIGGTAHSALAAEIDKCLAAGNRLDPPALKRVPSPWPQDHPRADLLKHKGLVLWHDFSVSEQTAPDEALRQTFTALAPFRALLTEALA